ncbi:MAG TPA: hypothetical protein VG916_06785 [Gemmatimonadaceae bacterium]|nr:hypothetical protein [Gemmatimonadaceae bacterium]
MPLKARCRAGTTLAELAIALVITGIAGAIGVGMLAAAERRSHADAVWDRAVQGERDVAHVLGSDIADADPAYLALRGDTALDLAEHVGVAVACAVAGRVLVVPANRTSAGEPYTAWRSATEAHDLVFVWDTTVAIWRESEADTVAARGDGAGCPATGPFRSAADSAARVPVTRFVLADSLPAWIGAGAPVRVARRVRWLLYRSADRSWWLGYRRCPRGVCGAAQPVAGPLASPADSGLLFAQGDDGTMAVTMRAPRDAVAPTPRTLRIWALRGAP